MAERSTVEGAVQSLIFQNEDNGYTVLSLLTDDGELVTVVGCIPCAAPGERMTVTGVWTNHPSYGPQFAAESVERRMPETEEDIAAYLASGILKGIGPATAQRLVDRFGADTLAVIEEEPERLQTVKGITAKKAMELSAAFRELTGLKRVMEFLARYELPVPLAMQLYRAYGAQALPRLKEDPYLLTGQAYGVAFSTMDEIALSMGFDGDSPCRVEAALTYELSHNLNNGHVFLPRDKLLFASAQLIGGNPDALETALDGLLARGGGAGLLSPAPVSGGDPGGPAAAVPAGRAPADREKRGQNHRRDGGPPGHRLCAPAAPGGGAGGPERGAAADRRPRHRQNHLHPGHRHPAGAHGPDGSAAGPHGPGGQAHE